MGKAADVQKHHFVLVHGASHGGWCWYKVRSLLEAAGHEVSCVDLASAGIDREDPNLLRSIEEYDAPLFALLSALPQDHKVILVGHSAGGLSATHALHHVLRDRIKLAIYVAATMLPWGFQTEEDTKYGAPDLSRYGDVFELTYALGPANPPTSMFLKKEFQRELQSQLSPIEDSLLASMLLRPCPAIFAGTKFSQEEEDVNQTKRVYIKTTRDNALSPEQQDAMIRRWPPEDVLEIEADHSPFFSAPRELFELLVKAATTCAEEDD